MLSKSLLLFLLNWLDAQLTLIWLRAGVAEEGNALMARVLALGECPFLTFKICLGAAVALFLFRWSHLALARQGLRASLAVYLALMLIHLATSLHALR